MGLVSGAVLDGGGDVTGVAPIAMVAGEGKGIHKDRAAESCQEGNWNVILNEKGREKVRTELMWKRYDGRCC